MLPVSRPPEHSKPLRALSAQARRLTDRYRRARLHGDDDRAALLLVALQDLADLAVAQLREARP